MGHGKSKEDNSGEKITEPYIFPSIFIRSYPILAAPCNPYCTYILDILFFVWRFLYNFSFRVCVSCVETKRRRCSVGFNSTIHIWYSTIQCSIYPNAYSVQVNSCGTHSHLVFAGRLNGIWHCEERSASIVRCKSHNM